MIPQIDLSSPDFLADRRGSYRRFRRDCPIATAVINDEEILVVTRYADAEALFRTSRAIVQPAPNEIPAHLGSGPASVYYRHNVAAVDAPAHLDLRKVLNPLFGPGAIARMTEWTREIVRRKIAEIDGADEIDFVSQIAFPVPLEVTCRLLDMPVEDAPPLLALLGEMTAIMSQAELGTEMLARSDAATRVYFDYFEWHLKHKLAQGADGFTAAILAAEEKGAVGHDYVISSLLAVFIGAIHTTMTSFSNAVAVLAAHPEQRALIRQDMALAEGAWEEILRYDTPVHFRHRYVSEPIEIGGYRIEPEKKVMIALASANLDEAQYERAETFDVTRTSKRHFAFGGGGHHCLGAHLARLEGQVFLSEFLPRFSDFCLSDEPAKRNEDLTFPHFERMPVRLEHAR